MKLQIHALLISLTMQDILSKKSQNPYQSPADHALYLEDSAIVRMLKVNVGQIAAKSAVSTAVSASVEEALKIGYDAFKEQLGKSVTAMRKESYRDKYCSPAAIYAAVLSRDLFEKAYKQRGSLPPQAAERFLDACYAAYDTIAVEPETHPVDFFKLAFALYIQYSTADLADPECAIRASAFLSYLASGLSDGTYLVHCRPQIMTQLKQYLPPQIGDTISLLAVERDVQRELAFHATHNS